MTILDLIPDARKQGREYGAPCPSCGGDDRLRIWPEQGRSNSSGQHIGRYWCRRCRTTGDAIDYLQAHHGMTFVEAAKAVDFSGDQIDRIIADLPDTDDLNAQRERYLARIEEMDAAEIMAETRAGALRRMRTCPSPLLVEAISREHYSEDHEAVAHLLGIVRWRLDRMQWLLERYHQVHRGQVEAFLRSEQRYPIDVFFKALGINREEEGWLEHGESWERWGEWHRTEKDDGWEFAPDWDKIGRAQAQGRYLPQSLRDEYGIEEIAQ